MLTKFRKLHPHVKRNNTSDVDALLLPPNGHHRLSAFCPHDEKQSLNFFFIA